MPETSFLDQPVGGYGGDPMKEQRIQYMYDMAQMNPQDSGLADAYMQSYMDYMYPQEDPLMQILGLGGSQGGGSQGGGSQGDMGGYGGGVDTNAYTAMMEGRMPQYDQMAYSPEGQPLGEWGAALGDSEMDIPDDEYQAFMQSQGQGQPSGFEKGLQKAAMTIPMTKGITEGAKYGTLGLQDIMSGDDNFMDEWRRQYGNKWNPLGI